MRTLRPGFAQARKPYDALDHEHSKLDQGHRRRASRLARPHLGLACARSRVWRDVLPPWQEVTGAPVARAHRAKDFPRCLEPSRLGSGLFAAASVREQAAVASRRDAGNSAVSIASPDRDQTPPLSVAAIVAGSDASARRSRARCQEGVVFVVGGALDEEAADGICWGLPTGVRGQRPARRRSRGRGVSVARRWGSYSLC